jgi:hypothetical protein
MKRKCLTKRVLFGIKIDTMRITSFFNPFRRNFRECVDTNSRKSQLNSNFFIPAVVFFATAGFLFINRNSNIFWR